MRTNLPLATRALRLRRRWRQVDLGRRAGRSRDLVSRIERGRLAGVAIGSLDRVADALGGVLVVELRWQGAGADRLIDRGHAQLVERTARRLGSAGWISQAEVSFNHYGDRGSCDLMAFYPATGAVLVVEAKTQLGDLQDTLHRLDVKARVARTVAAGLGWPEPSTVARALVLAEHRTSRRIVDRHAHLFATYGVRGRHAHRWLKRPIGSRAALLWFEVLPDSDQGRVTGAARVRRRHAAG